MTVRRSAPCLFGRLLLPALLIAGCAQPDVPQLGQVTGIVTLNGEPLPHARVCFTPDTGRPSVGLTGASGRYWLTYKANIAGAVTGHHTVAISTENMIENRASGQQMFVKERVPERYNTKTELEAHIVPGQNEWNFALQK